MSIGRNCGRKLGPQFISNLHPIKTLMISIRSFVYYYLAGNMYAADTTSVRYGICSSKYTEIVTGTESMRLLDFL